MDLLPPELLDTIAQHLEGSSRDLQAFALCCHRMNEVARKLIDWKLYGVNGCLGFLDLLLRDQEDLTALATLPASVLSLAKSCELASRRSAS